MGTDRVPSDPTALPLPAAVLWDLDGTLVDTEPLWFGAEFDLAAEVGGTWTLDDAHALIGSDLMASGEVLRRHHGTDRSAAEIVDYLVERVVAGLRAGPVWRPGARELVAALHDAGVPQALVTMSYEPIATPIAEALGLDVRITGDRVSAGKPHPEPYLAAARALQVDPRDCVAIEDSPTGAASATAAGCRVLAVEHLVAVPDAPRRTRVTSLETITPNTLAALPG